MKILLAGPCFDDSFVENVKTALVEMGHEVLGSEPKKLARYWSLPNYAIRVIEERIRGDRPSRDDRHLLEIARARRPDLVLALTWDVHVDVLHELGRITGKRRVLWWGDPTANSRRWGILNPGWDRVYLKDRDAVVKLRLAGRSADLLHEACNPKWHRVVAQQRDSHVVVAGNYYAFRQAIVARLLRDGVTFRLYGPAPPLWSLPSIKATWSGEYVVRERKSLAFGEGLACLNTFHPAEGNSLNCRAFEIAGAGGLQLIEHRPILEDCFEPGRELLPFRTYEELLALIERARSCPKEMAEIRAAAARRAHAEHTYRHRIERILSDLS
jgi:spore maturation protein CgeB